MPSFTFSKFVYFIGIILFISSGGAYPFMPGQNLNADLPRDIGNPYMATGIHTSISPGPLSYRSPMVSYLSCSPHPPPPTLPSLHHSSWSVFYIHSFLVLSPIVEWPYKKCGTTVRKIVLCERKSSNQNWNVSFCEFTWQYWSSKYQIYSFFSQVPFDPHAHSRLPGIGSIPGGKP